jgi:farnesyl-diphosphate farnesyltransferase
MLESTNLRGVCEVFLRYTREIHQKSTPKDPNFLAISAACGKIEQFIETVFPSSTRKSIQQLQLEAERAERHAAEQAMTPEDKREIYTTYAAIVGMWIVLFGVMTLIAWLLGARFDFIFRDARKVFEAVFGSGGGEILQGTPGHGEL